MTSHYLEAVSNASHYIEKIMKYLTKNYNVCITADHGGHHCTHNTDCMEDMTIPLICHGPIFQPNHLLANVNIKDIAPTLIQILGLIPPSDWKWHYLLDH